MAKPLMMYGTHQDITVENKSLELSNQKQILNAAHMNCPPQGIALND
jgi:hypothetical protein